MLLTVTIPHTGCRGRPATCQLSLILSLYIARLNSISYEPPVKFSVLCPIRHMSCVCVRHTATKSNTFSLYCKTEFNFILETCKVFRSTPNQTCVTLLTVSCPHRGCRQRRDTRPPGWVGPGGGDTRSQAHAC